MLEHDIAPTPDGDRVATPEELRTTEAVIYAEKLVLMIEILHGDARAHAQKALELAQPLPWGEGADMALASSAIDLAKKADAMLAEMKPLIDDAIARDVQARKDRSAPTTH